MGHINFYLKVIGTALLRWLALSCIGSVFSVIGMEVGFTVLDNAYGEGACAWEGGLRTFINTFTCFHNAPGPVLLINASLVFIAIYILLAFKLSLGFALSQIFENKLYPIIGDRVSGLLTAIMNKQPGLAQASEYVSSLREKLINSANGDSTLNKIQRKAICYGLKKCRLGDIDFQQPH